MKLSRWLYRGKQFWSALTAKPQPAGLEAARRLLTPAQYLLFQQLQPSEQAHALVVMHKIRIRAPEAPEELLQAALLHDIGKARYPLRLWERVVIVLGEVLFGDRVDAWGSRPPQGWARPFVVACRHPAWGAEMVKAAGASPLVVSLVLRHQTRLASTLQTDEDRLLRLLQAADDES